MIAFTAARASGDIFDLMPDMLMREAAKYNLDMPQWGEKLRECGGNWFEGLCMIAENLKPLRTIIYTEASYSAAKHGLIPNGLTGSRIQTVFGLEQGHVRSLASRGFCRSDIRSRAERERTDNTTMAMTETTSVVTIDNDEMAARATIDDDLGSDDGTVYERISDGEDHEIIAYTVDNQKQEVETYLKKHMRAERNDLKLSPAGAGGPP